MPLRVAEKDGFLYAVNGCGGCPFSSRMLTGVKDHLKSEIPSGFGCFHDDITTRKEIGKAVKLDRIPIWCPLPREEDKTPLRKLIDFLKESKTSGVLTEEQFNRIVNNVRMD